MRDACCAAECRPSGNAVRLVLCEVVGRLWSTRHMKKIPAGKDFARREGPFLVLMLLNVKLVTLMGDSP